MAPGGGQQKQILNCRQATFHWTTASSHRTLLHGVILIVEVKSRSPRFGREKEWFVVTGRVAQVKAEEDGDLHIELRDADNPHGVLVVVEVPLDSP